MRSKRAAERISCYEVPKEIVEDDEEPASRAREAAAIGGTARAAAGNRR
jgi:hypothetical protein